MQFHHVAVVVEINSIQFKGRTSGSATGPNIISNVRKMKWFWTGRINALKTTDGHRVSSRGNHTTRKDVKGDQPSGGETTWTNTGATQSGRGQRKTG